MKKLPPLAAPIFSGVVGSQLQNFQQASVHPYVGELCAKFMDNVIPLMEKNGQRKRNLKDIAARSFMQGAFECALIAADGVVPTHEIPGEGVQIHPDKDLGALALFVGGTMVRSGFYASVEQYAAIYKGEMK